MKSQSKLLLLIQYVRHSPITLPIFTVESQTVKSRMLADEFQLYKVIHGHLDPEYQNVFALQKRDVDRLLQNCLLLNKLQRQILNCQIQIVQILPRPQVNTAINMLRFTKNISNAIQRYAESYQQLLSNIQVQVDAALQSIGEMIRAMLKVISSVGHLNPGQLAEFQETLQNCSPQNISLYEQDSL
ncbi:Hypothetical_protein [Hexamita inflata]|uniref:Hypothetical_protein n=1 Tax=Hexamita inflata TaxID=28002 RepID=A0AA86Q244_9EUKA|nr:Hypothetical protein HINF_LOCUS38166 [Hexamita inflata]